MHFIIILNAICTSDYTIGGLMVCLRLYELGGILVQTKCIAAYPGWRIGRPIYTTALKWWHLIRHDFCQRVHIWYRPAVAFWFDTYILVLIRDALFCGKQVHTPVYNTCAGCISPMSLYRECYHPPPRGPILVNIHLSGYVLRCSNTFIFAQRTSFLRI